MTKIKVHGITSKKELEQAFSIRNKVFVVDQGVPAEEEYDEFDAVANHYLAIKDASPVGTARWRETDKGVKLERFAVLNDFRNMGIGKELIAAVLKDIPSPSYVYLHAQLPAINVYKRAGFEVVGEMFLECEIEHFKMFLRL